MKMLWGIPMRFQNVVTFQICSYVTVCLSYMMTSSNGNFSTLLALSAGNSPVTGEFPAQRPVTRGYDVFFDLRLNGRLSKQSWGWWFEKLLRPLWRHSNDNQTKHKSPTLLLARYEENPVVTDGFPSQRARTVESVSMSWRHHDTPWGWCYPLTLE